MLCGALPCPALSYTDLHGALRSNALGISAQVTHSEQPQFASVRSAFSLRGCSGRCEKPMSHTLNDSDRQLC